MTGLLASASSAADKRAVFRAGLNSGRLQRFPGVFSPLVAKLVAEIGFEGVYVSGAVLSADLGLPDIGLTTLTEVAGRGAQIASVTDLPTLIDADTGFGEPMSAARTITLLEDAGLAGCHLEDQVNPKRCGHLDGKAVVPAADMVKRLRAAVAARRDPNFVICARTDAAAIEGIDAAVERARAYADAGADLIFTEALTGPADFEKFRAAVDIPLLANMTEFGKSELLTTSQLDRHRLQRRDLPGHHAAAGDARRRGRIARNRSRRNAIGSAGPRCSTARGSTSCCDTPTTTNSTTRSSTLR